MKQHAVDASVGQLGETSCGALGSVYDDRQSVQYCITAGCTDINSDAASHGDHDAELTNGENNPVDDCEFQQFQHDVVGDTSTTRVDSTRDGTLDCVRIKCDSSCNEDHLDDNCESDSNQQCHIKNAAVGSISEERDSYDDRDINCSAETQLQITPVQSIAEECEFSCLKKLLLQNDEVKRESTVSESDSYLAIIDGAGESVAPIVIKPEPTSCDESTQMTTSSNNSKTMRSILTKSCDSLPPGSFNPWTTVSDVFWPDCGSALASAMDVRENIDVVGDCADDSETDSADDCNRSLGEVVPGNTWSHWRDISRAGESTPAGMTPPELNNTYGVVSLNNGELPTLFVEVYQPDTDTNSAAAHDIASEHDSTLALSESGHGDQQWQRIHHDHTYADNGIHGSLTCARTRLLDPTVRSAWWKGKRILRPRAPTKYHASEINESDVGAAPISPIRVRSPKKMAKPFRRGFPLDDTIYCCTVCQNRDVPGEFRSRAEFCTHVINRHSAVGGRLYYCAYCRYVAMDMDLVKSHMNDEHGNETTRIVSGMRLHELAKKTEPEGRVTKYEVYLPKKNQTYKEDAKSGESGGVTADKHIRQKTSRRVKVGANKRKEDGAVHLREALRGSPNKSKTVSGSHRKRATPTTRLTNAVRTRVKSEPSSPSMTRASSYSPSPDYWHESPAAQYDLFDNHLDDCGLDLIDGTCCDMFEDRFMEWDETETLGSPFSVAANEFETSKIDDASGQYCGLAVKQEPLTSEFVESSDCGQGSRRYSRRTRKPSLRGLCNSRDAVSLTGKRRMPRPVDRHKKPATSTSVNAGSGTRRRLAVGDKTVVSPHGGDPKLKMRPIVRLCDIIMAIVAGGSDHI